MLLLNSSKVREQRLYCKNTEKCLFLVHTVHKPLQYMYTAAREWGVVPPVMFVWYTSVYTCLPTTVYPSAPQTQEQGDKLPVCFLCPTHVHPPQKYLPCLMCSGSCALPAKAVNCSAYSCFSRVVSHKYNKAIPQSHNCLMLGDQCLMMHDTIELPHGEIGSSLAYGDLAYNLFGV